jgi:hypothetical protein
LLLKNKRMIKKFLFFSAVISLASCGNSSTTLTDTPPKDSLPPQQVSQPENDLADFEFHTLVLNIPSPFEIVSLLPRAGVPYNTALPNPTGNQQKYTTSTKKGMNYGAYVVDLVYLSTNEQYAQLKDYFKACRSMAADLGAAESFDKLTGSRLEKSIDNKDTINMIMDQIYMEMDNYLRSNDRLLAATQILVGSWVESQYITLALVKDVSKDKNNEVLFTKIYEQRSSVDKLTELLKQYENEKEFNATIKEVNELAPLYKELKEGEPDKALLNKIYEKLSSIRTKIVS